MTFDEQHEWVERGTKGHRASAQVVEVKLTTQAAVGAAIFGGGR